jgi:2-keto-4-pentenoate hydratase/2-oxohepta-3-ene-1,7-dioic acid hydratase in catechol pathway
MRLARFEHDGTTGDGIVVDAAVYALPAETTVLSALLATPDERDRMQAEALAGAGVAIDAVRLLAPLQPPAFRDYVCFEQHIEGALMLFNPDAKIMPEWYEAPRFYFTNPASVNGTGADIEVPPGSQALDFELEVAAIIGHGGRDLTGSAARDAIAGYTIYNDWSARDHASAELRFAMGMAKAKDFANTLGPWIVTADELARHRDGDRLDLTMIAEINGVEVGRDSLASMAWSFEDMVTYASRGVVLQPGEALGSGTCGGGSLAELWGRAGARTPPPLQPGDEVRLTVEGIGTLVNRIVPGVDPVPVPAARAREVTAPGR